MRVSDDLLRDFTDPLRALDPTPWAHDLALALSASRAELARLKSAPDAIGEVERLRCRHAQELKIALPGTLAAFRAQDMLAAVDEILSALRTLPTKEPARPAEGARTLTREDDAALKEAIRNSGETLYEFPPAEGAVAVVERCRDKWVASAHSEAVDADKSGNASAARSCRHAASVVKEFAGEVIFNVAALRTTDGGDGWQPIATAPKDGTIVLIFREGMVYAARWSPQYKTWGTVIERIPGERDPFTDVGEIGFGSLIAAHGPTHWRPLPEPPAIKGEG